MSTRSSLRFGLAALLVVGAVAITMAATAAPPPLNAPQLSVRAVGPFVSMQAPGDSANGNAVGGYVRQYNACTGQTIKVGDAVFLGGNNCVSASTTAADHEKLVGIAVGGRSTSMYVSGDSVDVGTTAAAQKRPVWVLVSGRTYARVDSATADTLHAGEACKPSTVTGMGGRIMPATTTITATISTADTSKTVKGATVSGPITVAGDGPRKSFCIAVRLAPPGRVALVDVNR